MSKKYELYLVLRHDFDCFDLSTPVAVFDSLRAAVAKCCDIGEEADLFGWEGSEFVRLDGAGDLHNAETSATPWAQIRRSGAQPPAVAWEQGGDLAETQVIVAPDEVFVLTDRALRRGLAEDE